MTGGLRIPHEGDLDLLALGALVMRLDPGVTPFARAAQYDVHVSGGEYNVAANLASCFGLRTGVLSAMVDYPIGQMVEQRVRAMGVRARFRRFEHDGVRGPNIATVFSDRGFGVRPPVVFYNRSNEAAGLLAPGDFDWPAIFREGVRWFHTGGIFAALSPSTSDLVLEAVAAARDAGVVVSFDLNYRPKLWTVAGGQHRAQKTLRQIVEHVDVLVGNEEDLQAGLGLPGPRVSSREPDPLAYARLIDETTGRFPRLRVVATTLRTVKSASRHLWTAAAWIDGTAFIAPSIELDVHDRVGGGDGFASGLFFGLLSGLPSQQAVDLGWAHGALIATFPGDTTMATLDQVRDLARGGSARIQR